MSNFLKKGKVVLLLGTLFLVFMILVLPYMAEMLHAVTLTSSAPDTSLSFDINSFYSMLEQYGSEGRRLYILQRWTFDVAWPIVYGLFLCSTTLFLSEKLHSNNRYYLFPIIGVVLDILENSFSSVTMAIYPNKLDILYYLLRISSMLKWSVILISFILILYLLGKVLKKVISK